MTRAGLAAALLAAIAVAALPRGRPDPAHPGRPLLSLIPYQDHRLVWDLPVEVRSGANAITLDQRNGAPFP